MGTPSRFHKIYPSAEVVKSVINFFYIDLNTLKKKKIQYTCVLWLMFQINASRSL